MTPRRRSLSWRPLVAALCLAACGGAFTTRRAGGESHFLHQCGAVSCGVGLECISGVCTRGCLVGEDKCTDLAARAICTDESIEPGALAVCDVSCAGDADCAALGADFDCAAGFCRGPILPGQQPSGGSTGNAGSGGSGVSAGPALYRTPACRDADGLAAPCPDGFACVSDPRASPGRRAICVEQSVLGACAAAAEACQEKFECVGGDCVPNAVNCWSPWTCEIADPPECPYGYGRSRTGVVDRVASCLGPCVPLTHCGCASDAECPEGAACDTAAGECAARLPWQPPSLCAQPFDPGPCDSIVGAYVAVDGVCTLSNAAGCEGTGNRFFTLESCMATCEGRPFARPCPDGRVQRKICLQCGDAGGCAAEYELCAQPCVREEDCDDYNLSCVDGFCAVGYCF